MCDNIFYDKIMQRVRTVIYAGSFRRENHFNQCRIWLYLYKSEEMMKAITFTDLSLTSRCSRNHVTYIIYLIIILVSGLLSHIICGNKVTELALSGWIVLILLSEEIILKKMEEASKFGTHEGKWRKCIFKHWWVEMSRWFGILPEWFNDPQKGKWAKILTWFVLGQLPDIRLWSFVQKSSLRSWCEH